MGKPLEEHMADYLLLMRNPRDPNNFWDRRYRRQCLEFWRERYGAEIADKVEAIVKKRWPRVEKG
jgi:hypothetical protein